MVRWSFIEWRWAKGLSRFGARPLAGLPFLQNYLWWEFESPLLWAMLPAEERGSASLMKSECVGQVEATKDVCVSKPSSTG